MTDDVGSGLGRRLRAGLRSPELPAVGLVAFLLVVVELFPRPMPAGLYLSGVIFGALSGLSVLGLVLVFRSTRVVNFSAFAGGSAASLLFVMLLQYHPIARVLSGHVHGSLLALPTWSTKAEYWLVAVLALAVGTLLSTLTYVLVVRRLRDTPPLVGTVATIAVAVLLTNGSLYVTRKVLDGKVINATTAPPLGFKVTLGGTVFRIADLVALGLGLAVLPALEIYLRRSRAGRSMRAAAENPERVATLGVDASRVTVVAWVLAGLLSTVAALLIVASQGAGQASGIDGFVAALAALVVAAATNLRLAMAAAVAIGVLQEGLLWSFPQRENAVYGALLVLVIGILLARRRRVTDRVDVTDTSWQAAREVRRVPPELKGHPEVRRLRRRTAAVVALAVVLYPLLVPTGQVALGSQTMIVAIVGLSLLMLTGWGGLVSLGQFGLAGVGAWTVAVLAGHGVSAVLALPAGALAAAVAAFLLGLPALRIRGLFLGVVTLAAAVAVSRLLLSPQYGGRYLPSDLARPSLFGLSVRGERAFYVLALVALAASLAAVGGLRRSRTGRALIATRDNERAAVVFGVDLVRARLQVFAVSGALAGLAGGLLAYQEQAVDSASFGAEQSLGVFLIVVLGGLGSLAGPILGAAFAAAVTLAPQQGVSVFAVPVAVLGVLLAYPGGLTQMVFSVRDSALRRIALRNRIVVPSLADRDHPGWTPEAKIPLADNRGGWLEPRYAMERHEPLTVPRVAATGKGA
ncbi:MAG: branched-chain amino acid transport system permease protein livM [Frankiales bacterium]|nr:branched-chain amino acid transport system permease protein livM [Frankiales bacterium]